MEGFEQTALNIVYLVLLGVFGERVASFGLV